MSSDFSKILRGSNLAAVLSIGAVLLGFQLQCFGNRVERTIGHTLLDCSCMYYYYIIINIIIIYLQSSQATNLTKTRTCEIVSIRRENVCCLAQATCLPLSIALPQAYAMYLT